MNIFRRCFGAIGLVDRRRAVDRTPIQVKAVLALDVVELRGTASDESPGGVFFETAAPIAPGVRGWLSRDKHSAPIPVRVSWRRDHTSRQRGGLGLVYEQPLLPQ
jgi:hypothetical protein